MAKRDLPGVKAESLVFAAAAVYIANDRMADRGTVDPQLICPAGHRLKLKKRGSGVSLPDPKPGLRGFAVGFHVPLLALAKAPDGLVDSARIQPDDAVNEGQIPFFDELLAKVFGHSLMGLLGLGDDDQAGSLFIQTMDEARTDRFPDVINVFAVEIKSQCVQQSAAFVAVCRMNQHARGLVDDDQLGIFIYHVDRQLLRTHGGLARQIKLYLDKVVLTYAIADVLGAAVHLALLVFDDVTQIHLAETAETAEQEFVEPFFVRVSIYDNFDAFSHGSEFNVIAEPERIRTLDSNKNVGFG